MKTKEPFALYFISTLLLGMLPVAAQSTQNLIANGDFEQGKQNWNLFAPGDAKAAGAIFELADSGAHTGQIAAKISSTQFARYGIGTRGVRVAPGERYRFSLWIKAAPDAQAKIGTSGFLARLTLQDGNTATPDDCFYLLADGSTVRAALPPPQTGKPVSLPQEWTKLETTLQIPEGANFLILNLFAWQASGSILIDDVILERE
ncbi:carbohydrate-binding protein [Opitutaceae bacterium TAV5]|nr:carbohydrate-binding protein [Opitutaceae bacterium TAV5]